MTQPEKPASENLINQQLRWYLDLSSFTASCTKPPLLIGPTPRTH